MVPFRGDEGIDLALFFRLHPVIGIKCAVGAIADRDPASNLSRQIVNFKFGDQSCTALAGENTLPGNFRSASKR